MNTLLISGASGVLAREIIKQQIERPGNFRIIALTGSCNTLKQHFSADSPISFYSWDDLDSIPFRQTTCIVHCAFARNELCQELYRALVCTQKLLRKAAENVIPFINISSRSVYGQNPNLPWTETSSISPNGAYALAKSAQELLTGESGETGGFPYTSLRLAGLMGVGMDARIISKLVIQAIKTKTLQIVGGNQQFALLDIRDAASGVLTVSSCLNKRWKPVYNLGPAEKYTLNEIALAVRQAAFEIIHKKINIETKEHDAVLIDGMDSSCFYKEFDWHPKYQLMDTIKSLFDSYSK